MGTGDPFRLTYTGEVKNGGAVYPSPIRLHGVVLNKLVAGSIPAEVTGFFNSPNPSSRTMDPGSTQPLREMSTRNLTGG
jgi:hypothetical protein